MGRVLEYLSVCISIRVIVKDILEDASMVRNIGVAIFINTTLFLGGLHQEVYVFFMIKEEWRN